MKESLIITATEVRKIVFEGTSLKEELNKIEKDIISNCSNGRLVTRNKVSKGAVWSLNKMGYKVEQLCMDEVVVETIISWF